MGDVARTVILILGLMGMGMMLRPEASVPFIAGWSLCSFAISMAIVLGDES